MLPFVVTNIIYKIAYNAINNKERPNYLLTGLYEPVKPKFTPLLIFMRFCHILNLQWCKMPNLYQDIFVIRMSY
jgi:hypothetical protein